MYLLTTVRPSIFVSYSTNNQVLQKKRKLFLAIIILVLCHTGSWSQSMWPGDINNNGVVSNVDALYWAVAKDATGLPRLLATTTWEEQLISGLWGIVFPNGLDFAFADCDGNGIVDDPDLDVIEANIDQTRAGFVPDDFSTGDSAIDPVLLLETDVTAIEPGQTVDIDIFLGDEDHRIQEFYGVAFKILYNPDLIGDQGNDVRFNISDETWVGEQMGNNAPIKFITNDPDAGVTQIAIVRKNQQTVTDSFGILGTLSIVMEDIVVGIAEDLEVEATDIKLINLETVETMVAASMVSIPIPDSTMTSTTGFKKEKLALNVYPNPTTGSINIELTDKNTPIERIELYDSLGRRILTKQWNESANTSLDLRQHLPGMYMLRVYTQNSILSQIIYR